MADPPNPEPELDPDLDDLAVQISSIDVLLDFAFSAEDIAAALRESEYDTSSAIQLLFTMATPSSTDEEVKEVEEEEEEENVVEASPQQPKSDFEGFTLFCQLFSEHDQTVLRTIWHDVRRKS